MNICRVLILALGHDPDGKAIYHYLLAAFLLFFSLPAVAQTISGRVYNDYDINGLLGPNEPGVENVVVTAFDANGNVVDVANTAADGSYVLTVGSTEQFRIETTGIPNYLRPGVYGSLAFTTIAFANGGESSLFVALVDPAEVCSADPLMATSCYVNGDPLANPPPVNNPTGTEDFLVAFPYSSQGHPASQGYTGMPSHLASGSQIGATWGLAYRSSTSTLYVGALMRRHVGLGPLGTGGIYAVDMTDPMAPIVSNYLDLSAGPNISTGTDPRSPGDLPGDFITPNLDLASYGVVGRIAIGDIDISRDQQTMYVMNLNTNELLLLDIDSATVTQSIPVGNPGCTNSQTGGNTDAEVRPWGIKAYRGEVYIGVVCSAEIPARGDADANIIARRPDLHAYVLRLNGGSFVPVLDFPLDYPRQTLITGQESQWYPWMDVYDPDPLANGAIPSFPQPILADIEFDERGDMILGFMDRFGLQIGGLGSLSPNGILLQTGVGGGDILHACNINGSFVLEDNPACPATASVEIPATPPVVNEYYWGDSFNFHNEISLGALALLPGSGEVVNAMFSPLNFRSGGVGWFNNDPNSANLGNTNKRYELYGPDEPGTLSKTVGIGDIELICPVAPVEIGNRVWFDANANGVQDAGEAHIPDVRLNLRDDQGAVVASAITDPRGEYYFLSDTAPTANNSPTLDSTGEVIGGLVFGANYTVEIDPSNFDPGNPLEDLLIAPVNADVSANGDNRDSDGADIGGGVVGVNLVIGSAGENNHSYDFGFINTIGIAAAKDIQDVVTNEGDYAGPNLSGTVTVTFLIQVQNIGDETLANIQVEEDLAAAIIGNGFTIVDLSSPNLTVNPGFNGNGDINLLTGTDSLAPDMVGSVSLTVLVRSGDNGSLEIMNQVLASGRGAQSQRLVTDLSNAGSVIDPTGDGITELNFSGLRFIPTLSHWSLILMSLLLTLLAIPAIKIRIS